MKKNKSLKPVFFDATQKAMKKKLDKKIFDKAWRKAKIEGYQLTGDMDSYGKELGNSPCGAYNIQFFYEECEADPTGKKMTANRENYQNTRRKSF